MGIGLADRVRARPAVASSGCHRRVRRCLAPTAGRGWFESSCPPFAQSGARCVSGKGKGKGVGYLTGRCRAPRTTAVCSNGGLIGRHPRRTAVPGSGAPRPPWTRLTGGM
ncbi:hypothetical protein Srubr_27960 [Streptomyces rubradiris]|uniref:Uncharacterized protein n=1 Tax=Streptomyces rubradiris TaxID=285531 RepID=A0ABQ3RAU1_STRRR|nr:hypothetical protein GCM10018792_50840 [Streptomyces rubradiris]GHI52950.1 hypothetical protein Srubr_27960 [Streptomyces rubradiris]